MKFQFGETIPQGHTVSAALGVNPAGKLTDKDLNKAVKLAGGNNYVVCADGDEIEGIVTSIEPHTVNDGYGFGSVLLHGSGVRVEATVVGTTLAVGDLVVAAAQAAVGTEQTLGKVTVKKGTAASQLTSGTYDYTERTPNTFIWRVISLLGDDGAATKTVLIEGV